MTEKRFQIAIDRTPISFAQRRRLIIVVSIERSDFNVINFTRRSRMCLADAATTNDADMFHSIRVARAPCCAKDHDARATLEAGDTSTVGVPVCRSQALVRSGRNSLITIKPR